MFTTQLKNLEKNHSVTDWEDNINFKCASLIENRLHVRQMKEKKEEKKKNNNIAKKIAPKRPRDHDDPAAIQVFEAQIHYLTLSLFYLYISL